MAIAYLRIENIGRGNNKSAIASAAYRSGTKMFDQSDGLTKNYEHKQAEVAYHKIFLPPTAPPEHADAETLWNAVQIAETKNNHNKNNCRFAKQVEIALPVELSIEDDIKIIEEFIAPICEKGYAVQANIHNKSNNPHVHILITSRTYAPDGSFDFTSPKQRKEYVYLKDANGNKIPETNADGTIKTDKAGNILYMKEPVLDSDGKQVYKEIPGHGKRKLWKRITVSTNYLDDINTVNIWKQTWSNVCNKYLLPEQQISFKLHSRPDRTNLPYEKQIIGQIHLGPAAFAMAKKHILTDKAVMFRKIKLHNKKALELLGITKEEWYSPSWKPSPKSNSNSDPTTILSNNIIKTKTSSKHKTEQDFSLS